MGWEDKDIDDIVDRMEAKPMAHINAKGKSIIEKEEKDSSDEEKEEEKESEFLIKEEHKKSKKSHKKKDEHIGGTSVFDRVPTQ